MARSSRQDGLAGRGDCGARAGAREPCSPTQGVSLVGSPQGLPGPTSSLFLVSLPHHLDKGHTSVISKTVNVYCSVCRRVP